MQLSGMFLGQTTEILHMLDSQTYLLGLGQPNHLNIILSQIRMIWTITWKPGFTFSKFM